MDFTLIVYIWLIISIHLFIKYNDILSEIAATVYFTIGATFITFKCIALLT